MGEIQIIRSGESAELVPQASGFAHGFGIFETMKLSAGRLCFWEAHWARLLECAAKLGLECVYHSESVLGAVSELVRSEGLKNGMIKLSLLKDDYGVMLYVYSRPLAPWPDAARLLLSTGSPINERSILAGCKTHNYMENMLLLQAAKAAGYDDLIRLNTAGDLTETTMGNLFFFDGEVLCTPSLETGILSGTVRAAVIKIAKSLSLELREAAFAPKALEGASAVFMTNASVGVLPVYSIGGMEVPFSADASPHALMGRLAAAFSDFEWAHSVEV